MRAEYEMNAATTEKILESWANRQHEQQPIYQNYPKKKNKEIPNHPLAEIRDVGPHDKLTSTEEQILINAFHRLINRKYVVFIGDSLMRYQYLSLASALHNQIMVDNNATENILVEPTWSDWNSFYIGSQGKLQPYEYCDCYHHAYHTYDVTLAVENRYYMNPA